MKCSNEMIGVLREYCENVQRFSVDECFMDMSNMSHIHGDLIEVAYKIKDRIYGELGFTVNIGISHNKLLAKMASDLKKPNMVHTLFPNEIEEKMWPLPVEELFMVGPATAPKLRSMGIYTIGDLAKTDISTLRYRFKSHGDMIWKYANGIEDSSVSVVNSVGMKSLGNSTTISFDVKDKETAHLILLSLTEMTSMRLRNSGRMCTLVAVSVKTHEVHNYSHQRKLYTATDCTKEIYGMIKSLFDEVWGGTQLRHLGIRLSGLVENENYQTSLFDDRDKERLRSLDSTIDEIRTRFGSKAIMRAGFLNSDVKPMTGGVYEDYPVMNSIL